MAEQSAAEDDNLESDMEDVFLDEEEDSSVVEEGVDDEL